MPTVPAEYLNIELEGDGLPDRIKLDGSEVPLIRTADGARGSFMLDAFRSVGFHRVEVAGTEFVFCTEDAKLRLDGIVKLLAFVEDAGLSWGKQLFFSDGTTLRHPKVDFAWLGRNGARIVALANAVAESPARWMHDVSSVERHGIGRVSVRRTAALLRSVGPSLLEAHPAGAVSIGGSRFFPVRVLASRALKTHDTIGNRRVTQLLRLAAELVRAVLRETMPREQRDAMEKLGNEIWAASQQFPFAPLLSAVQSSDLPPHPVREEISDPRYREAFDLYDELSHDLVWAPGTRVANRFAYVNYADEIYQAFVVSSLARAFDAPSVGPALMAGRPGPSFQSDRFELYYDTAPPKGYMKNWRGGSGRPSEMAPDVLVVERGQRKGILGDAKYRVDASDRAPSNALAECQVYMQSFKQPAVVVFYPGVRRRIAEVTDGTNLILEVALSPGDGLDDYLRNEVRPRLEAAMVPLSAGAAA